MFEFFCRYGHARLLKRLVSLSLVLGLSFSNVVAQVSLPPEFSATTYVDGMYRPVDLEWAPNGTLYVGTKKGIIWVVKNGIQLPTPFLDIQPEVNGTTDRGMLGIETHPNFPATPYVYLLYTYDPPETAGQSGTLGPDGKGQRVSRLVRVTADSATDYETMVPGSEVLLLGTASTWSNIGDPSAEQNEFDRPWACGNPGGYIEDCIPADGISHTIGTVQFGPDGMLYVSVGDAASYSTVDTKALRSLSLDSLAGKILRVDPATGEGLADNPYWDGDPDSNRSKVWNYGVRNPYRINFDPNTAKLWIGDVGWGDWEELNLSSPGADFGWPCYEGADAENLKQDGYELLAECQSYYVTENAVPSVYGWEHVPVFGGAIVIGDVYTGVAWPTEYQNAMFFSDYATQEIFYAKFVGDTVAIYPFATDLLAVDIVMGPDGQLYTVDVVNGEVLRIAFQGAPNGDVVAGFSADFNAGSPAAGWNYKWNATSALASPAGHQALLWDSSTYYDSDGFLGLPDATAMYNGFVGDGIMTPGRGVADGELDNRHAIAEYTVGQDGYYSIHGSSAIHIGCASSDGVQITVLVDGAAFESRLLDPGDQTNFDESLGYLTTGSTVAVALGPNGTEVCDETNIDWSIVYLEGPAPVGNPPLVTITSPSDGALWVINDTVSYAGSANDPEDGPLTGGSLAWEVTVFHNEHQHPDFINATGASGSFAFPDHDDNSFLEICLVATDSDGRIGRDCVDANPDEVLYTFESGPTSLDLSYNGRSQTTPFTVPVPVGGLRQIGAPTWQGTLLFDNWSLGGSAVQQIIVGPADLTVTANYVDLGGVPQSFDVQIAAIRDDAEEGVLDGVVSTGSSDLEMVDDGGDQLVGLRFTGLPMDSGAVITNAWLQFTADEEDAVPTLLLIEGEAGNSFAGFSSSNKVSDRTRTVANVSWDVPAWNTVGEAGASQRTPNLANVVTEIINTPGWQSGNSMAFIVSGSGKRVADAHDGDSGVSTAAVLHIEYVYPVSNSAPVVVITDPADGASTSNGTNVAFAATANDAEDGDVGASLTWSSSIDGIIGSGAGFSSLLSIGTHTVTASVTDSGGQLGQASLEITVTPVVSPSGDVAIDVIPGDETNFIDTSASVPLPVAVLTTNVVDGDAADFDSAQVDGATLVLGPLAATPIDPAGSLSDVDSDGDMDRTFIFNSGDAGIQCEATELDLSGSTFGGEIIQGSDAITTDNCPVCHP